MRTTNTKPLWCYALAYRGVIELVGVAPTQDQARDAVTAHVRVYHHARAQRFDAVEAWLETREGEFDLSIVEQPSERCDLPTPNATGTPEAALREILKDWEMDEVDQRDGPEVAERVERFLANLSVANLTVVLTNREPATGAQTCQGSPSNKSRQSSAPPKSKRTRSKTPRGSSKRASTTQT
jgi:hypothetical protein